MNVHVRRDVHIHMPTDIEINVHVHTHTWTCACAYKTSTCQSAYGLEMLHMCLESAFVYMYTSASGCMYTCMARKHLHTFMYDRMYVCVRVCLGACMYECVTV